MVRAAARLALLVALALSLAGMVASARHLATGWPGSAFVARGAAGIRAQTDRLMAVYATPARLSARLGALLSETPRNWLAIEAVEGVARDRGIALPPGLEARRRADWDADHGIRATASACLSCAVDAATCTLSATLICQAPMVLTPLGDIAGAATEGGNYLAGRPVDRVNLALSAVGLGASALVVATAGGSGTLALGAGVARLAHRMGLLSPRLIAMARDAARTGIDWARLPEVRSAGDLRRALRPRALRPLAEVARETGRIDAAVGPRATLHLMRYVDDASDARHMADAAEALGPKTVGRAEVLGRRVFLRATLRWSRRLWHLAAAVAAAVWALAALVGHGATHLALRRLRRLAAHRGAAPARVR